MPKRPPDYARSDGWILAAAAHAGRHGERASWRAIVGSADYLNDAVPTFEELAGAAARLAAGGLVTYDKRGLTVAPAVLALIDEGARDLRRRFAQVWALARPADGEPSRPRQWLAREAYDEAVRIHRQWG